MRVGEEVTFKLWYSEGDTVTPVPENKAYAPRSVPAKHIAWAYPVVSSQRREL